MPCAYVIENQVNGKLYVGFTSGSFETRWKRHQMTTRVGYTTYFIHSMRKHGTHNFIPIAVFECQSVQEAKLTEMMLIALFKTTNPSRGYNLTAGGEGLINPTEEVRRKISVAGIGRNPSEETRKKISVSKLGNCHWLGRKHKPETLIKMSKACLGRPAPTRGKKLNLTPEQREARRTRMLGNKLYQGVVMSPEVRARHSESMKQAWVRYKRSLA